MQMPTRRRIAAAWLKDTESLIEKCHPEDVARIGLESMRDRLRANIEEMDEQEKQRDDGNHNHQG